MITFQVIGMPKGDPRHRARAIKRKKPVNGKCCFASTYPDSTANDWKRAVRDAGACAAIGRDNLPLTGPVSLDIEFLMPRPKSHYVAGDPKRPLKASAPHWHIKIPDKDNLEKAVMDALTRWPKGAPPLLFKDDCIVCRGEPQKRYANPGEEPGCLVKIKELEQ